MPIFYADSGSFNQIQVSGSIVLSGSTTLQGTASFATTASHALNAGSGTPGGSNTTIQFNRIGAFSGSNNFTFNSASNQVQLSGSLIVSNSVDTSLGYLRRPNNGSPTIDWSNGYLGSDDGSGGVTGLVDWGNQWLQVADYSTNPATPYIALDWLNGVLNQIIYNTPFSSSVSLDWFNRNLHDQNSNVALSWVDTGSNNGVRLYGTASYALAAQTFPFTGAAIVTGSLTVVTGSSIELQVTNTGVKIGNAIGDTHTITGSVSTSGSLTVGSGSLAITSPAAITAPFTINALNTTNTNYAAQITAGSGMQGLRVNTNGQSQYVARNTNITDRELRFQLFTDGHMYFQQVVTAGTTGSNLIIRTSGDGGTNTGSVIIASAGTQRLRSGTTGIKIGSEATLIAAGATLDISGSTLITGSLLTSGSVTDVGTSTISGSLTFAMTSSVSPFNGEIVRFGAGTLTAGQLYFLSSSGTWSLANANSTGSSTGMLGIAVGSSPTTNGLLVRGFAFSGSFTQSTGSILYVATSSGIFTETSPSSSNHVVRVVGYKTTIPGTVYFDPDKTWVTLA